MCFLGPEIWHLRGDYRNHPNGGRPGRPCQFLKSTTVTGILAESWVATGAVMEVQKGTGKIGVFASFASHNYDSIFRAALLKGYMLGFRDGTAQTGPPAMTMPPAVTDPDKLLTSKEAWRKADISERKFRRHEKAGKVKRRRMGKHGVHLFTNAEIDRWIREENP